MAVEPYLDWDQEFQDFLDAEHEKFRAQQIFEEHDRRYFDRYPLLGDDADGEGWT